MNRLPEKLIELRKYYKYSQEYVANYLNIAVFDYVDVENGTKILSYSLLKKLAELYKIETSNLFINSEEVILHEIQHKSVDEDNIKYFTSKPKNLKTLIEYLKKHYIMSAIIVSLSLAIIVLTSIIIINKQSVNLDRDVSILNRLSVNDYDVFYIDTNSGIKASGANDSQQLSYLPTSNIISVKQGADFVVFLDHDGKVTTSKQEYKEEVESLSNIVEIGCGQDFIVALDSGGKLHYIGEDETLKAQVEKLSLVTKIFVTNKAVLSINKNNELTITGTLLGSSVFKEKTNILDVDTSDKITVILYDDGTVAYKEINNKTFQGISSWKDIVDVCCGDNFIAGLKSDGSVVVASNNTKITQSDVSEWSNIIAIGAGNNYLIGLSNDYKVVGEGNNDYGQFEKDKEPLPKLTAISSYDVSITRTLSSDTTYKINVSFIANKNASSYKVELVCDDGKVLSNEINENSVDFLVDIYVESVTVKITCLGDNFTYTNSDTTVISQNVSDIYCDNCTVKNLTKLDPISSDNIYLFKYVLDDGRIKLEVYLVDELKLASNYKYEIELDNGTIENHYSKNNNYSFIIDSSVSSVNVSVTCIGDNVTYSNSDTTTINNQVLASMDCFKCELDPDKVYEFRYNFTNLNLQLATHIFDYYNIKYSLSEDTCDLNDASLKVLEIEGISNKTSYTVNDLANLEVKINKCGK